MDSTSSAATPTNTMNILQQFSQLLFLQNLVAGNVPSTSMNPGMFGFPSQNQKLFQQSPEHNTYSSPPTSTSNSPTRNLPTLSALLSSPAILKSQLSPITSPTQSDTFKMYQNNICYENIHSRKYRVHVNRESSKPLQDWLNLHITHPYPTAAEVEELSKQTGFTIKQIRNWFTNNRRRYEMKCGSSPLPWIKKDGPKICRKSTSSLQSSSSELEDGEIVE